MKTWKRSGLAMAAAAACGLHTIAAHAGEGFQLRYNIAGSLGGEMFGTPAHAGIVGAAAVTDININHVAGPDGHELTAALPGGTVPLPAPTPAALYPTYTASPVKIRITGTADQVNVGVGYVTDESYAGGRIAFGVNIPYGYKTQTVDITGTTPTLQFNPLIPAATQSAVQGAFGAGYQNSLSQQSTGETGVTQALGDIDLQVGWGYVTEKFRMLTGASLVLPTGDYAPNVPSIGFGKFYTLRPSIQAVYLPVPEVALAGKVTVGLNTRNSDNHLRSGDWLGLELAAGYRTPVGPVGLHTVYVQQYQADSGNSLGQSRLSETNIGAFFTTKAPLIDGASLTLQYMETVDARNARSGRFIQARVLKLF